MADEIAIKVEHVSKNFVLPHEKINSVKSAFTGIYRKRNKGNETQHALRDISFEIKKGEFFGIVGRNGSGKSTMLKILANIYQPTSGSVVTHGKLVPFIELGVGFNPELTGRENVYLNGAMLGFARNEIDAMYNDIVSFAELERFMDQKLKNYSSGMQVRLAFSMATRSEADILLVDEVLAVGDADFQRKCFDYFRKLKRDKKTVVFVTHDMNAVREYCDRAVMIEDSELVVAGSPDKVASSYSKMFIESADDADEDTRKTRWGDGTIKYQSAVLKKKKLIADDEFLEITVTLKAMKDIERPIFGFSVKDGNHRQLLGTNTVILRQPVAAIKAGESMTLHWKIPNVFNDGTYYVDVAAAYNNGSQTADWWEEAASFRTVHENKTPYPINPPIKLAIEAKKS